MLTIRLRTWASLYFKDRRVTHCGFTIAFVIILLNVPVLVTNGYSIEVNGTEQIICYAWYYNDYTIFDIMGQVGFYC